MSQVRCWRRADVVPRTHTTDAETLTPARTRSLAPPQQQGRPAGVRCRAAAPHDPLPAAAAAAAMAAGRPPMQRDAREITSLLLQLSRLDVRPHNQFLEEALAVVQEQLPTLGAAELCACMRALASWGYAPPAPQLAALEARSLEAIARGGFSPKQLSEMAWCLAQLGLRQRPLLPVILTGVESAMRTPSPSDPKPIPAEALADVIWAAARLQHEPLDAAWLAAFFETSRPRMREFTPSQSARTLWALARLQVVPPALWMESFLAAALAGLRGLDIKSLSLTLWALATLCGLGAQKPTRGWLAAFEGHAELYVRQLATAPRRPPRCGRCRS
ncbi:hypothetical protein Rsub_04427 [Raphidocelis subcapitata]|uniref:Uncharacterized protein n=1 Tax=Raphidocelis subcapitata TaxID=307507 RepID=A0A2V0P2L1_9CHLO|nr:hypothetical protein Rsub_04427 [Raphidocelis subcapitata]|eukprot:GBF92080.1 hypothetical protein Rsub_04427 [Raphidocelis subcapitata]